MNLLLVIVGFSLIIVVHELGHFLAARWARIRVLAFAVGFGPALLSWRKGLGLRFGGSEAEYLSRLDQEGERCEISETEYRLNYLPFGGYVKMLGQEDLDPTAVSEDPDSYQNCVPWKRMIVISAGVVMNLITGALLFMIVFMAGLRSAPPAVGAVEPGSPAARARALNADETGITRSGLRSGDRILAVDGEPPTSFKDLMLASMMSKRGQALHLLVERDGVEQPLEFSIAPEMSARTQFRYIGIQPPFSTTLTRWTRPSDEELASNLIEDLGWKGVKPGMTLVRVADRTDVRNPDAIVKAAEASGGLPVEIEFREDQDTVIVQLQPRPELQLDVVYLTEADEQVPLRHLLGLAPVMKVARAGERALEQGLKDGDVFLRIGDVEFPSVPQGVQALRQRREQDVTLSLLRDGEVVEITASVSEEGKLGFQPGDTALDSVVLSHPPQRIRSGSLDAVDRTPPAASLLDRGGSTVLSVSDVSVGNFAELRAALRAQTLSAWESGEASAELQLSVVPAEGSTAEQIAWTLDREAMGRIHELGWTTPLELNLFRPEEMLLKAHQPIEAIRMGFAETHRMVLTTYVTFARLFQGTVKVEHLKGPIGIAHLGKQVAERGYVELLFFIGLISVNLAVINFLPLPIVDGGQFLFLLFEQVMGRPVSLRIQNAVTWAGLVLIAGLFLFITYNDIVGLFRAT